jgi:hypothetical protein
MNKRNKLLLCIISITVTLPGCDRLSMTQDSHISRIDYGTQKMVEGLLVAKLFGQPAASMSWDGEAKRNWYL